MKQFVIALLVLILGFVFYGFSLKLNSQENEVPEVKIVFPKKDVFHWNDLVSYEISISDREDGESEYEEINVNEVFLLVKYLKDSTYLEDYLNSETTSDYDPLVEMGTRSCLNCHKLNGTLIGPSFYKISEKYKKEPEVVEKLAKKIIAGGSNVWGKEIMPAHPDLDVTQAKELVDWILTYNFNDEHDILLGTSGSFRIKNFAKKSKSEVCVLTAFYTDHGINRNGQGRNRGQYNKVLQIK